jgi:hypothetical protein
MDKYNAMMQAEEQQRYARSAAEDSARRTMFAEETALREFYYREHRQCQRERWAMRAEEYYVREGGCVFLVCVCVGGVYVCMCVYVSSVSGCLQACMCARVCTCVCEPHVPHSPALPPDA